MAAALPPGPPQEAIVRHLLAAGADPTLRNLENEQPVHLLRPGPGPEGVSAEPEGTGDTLTPANPLNLHLQFYPSFEKVPLTSKGCPLTLSPTLTSE